MRVNLLNYIIKEKEERLKKSKESQLCINEKGELERQLKRF